MLFFFPKTRDELQLPANAGKISNSGGCTIAVRVITGQILSGTFQTLWVVKVTRMLSCVLSCVRKTWVVWWEVCESAKKTKIFPSLSIEPFLELNIPKNRIIRDKQHHVCDPLKFLIPEPKIEKQDFKKSVFSKFWFRYGMFQWITDRGAIQLELSFF